jgi:hypothetical protein
MTLPSHFSSFYHFNNVLATVQALHNVTIINTPVLSFLLGQSVKISHSETLRSNFISPVCEGPHLTPHGTSVVGYINKYMS